MKFYDAIDEPAEKHFKKILFPGEDQITDRYKNRTFPKLLDKNFKYNPASNNLDDEPVNEFKEIKNKIKHSTQKIASNLNNSLKTINHLRYNTNQS